jgi:hypothetical protein
MISIDQTSNAGTPDSDDPPSSTTDEASQLSNTLTLTSDDGSFTQTLSFASDCQDVPSDGTSILTFKDLTDGRTYSLQAEDAAGSYTVFSSIPFHDLVPSLSGNDAAANDCPPASGPASCKSKWPR